MSDGILPDSRPRAWEVGALCRAIADALDARFNPVAVCGEISGFSRAASGHCYFSLKDAQGQLRCAMFRRAASLLGFQPKDGAFVEVQGRLDVYGPRGDLQLIVESMTPVGQGALFEQFLLLKARLEAEGLFDLAAKRSLPPLPRGIGIVTSLGAAALRDVMTALRRRLPHIPVLLAPAAVQGAGAPAALIAAMESLWRQGDMQDGARFPLDVLLLVRGGGSLEDLWAFNDESLARAIRRSPVPVVSGVGHETDFTIADFVADLRAPTPTAAAELVAQPREVWLNVLEALGGRMADAMQRVVDVQEQRLDQVQARLGRPSALMMRRQLRLQQHAQSLRQAVRDRAALERLSGRLISTRLPTAVKQCITRERERTERLALRLELLDPELILQRGYAWLADMHGHAIGRVAQAHVGAPVRATLVDGEVDLVVTQRLLI